MHLSVNDSREGVEMSEKHDEKDFFQKQPKFFKSDGILPPPLPTTHSGNFWCEKKLRLAHSPGAPLLST